MKNDSQKIDPTSWLDWIVLIYGIFVTLFLVSSVIIIIVKRNYAPIKITNVRLLIIMEIAGILHIWAALVTHEHFIWLAELEHKNCMFWNYWLQFFFGLFPWIFSTFIRLLTYASIFSICLNETGVARIKRYKWLSIFIIGFPLLLILSLSSMNNAVSFDTNTGKCTSTLELKIALLFWVTVLGLILIITLYLANSSLSEDPFGEFSPLKKVIFFGIVVIFFNAIIIMSNFLHNTFLRSIATANVISLYFFSTIIFIGKQLFKAVLPNNSTHQYNTLFTELQGTTRAKLWHVSSIVRDPESGLIGILQDFLEYCQTQSTIEIPIKNVYLRVKATFLVDFYNTATLWKEKGRVYFKDDNKTLKEDYDFQGYAWWTNDGVEIITQYMDESGQNYAYLDKLFDCSSVGGQEFKFTLFDHIVNKVFDLLDDSFGEAYLETEIYQRMICTNNHGFTEKLEVYKHQVVLNRLSNAKLVNPGMNFKKTLEETE